MKKDNTTSTAPVTVTVSFTPDELVFIARALKSYSGVCLESMDAEELAKTEIRGRKLCTKVMRAFSRERGRVFIDMEQAYIDARDSYCGIGPDDELLGRD